MTRAEARRCRRQQWSGGLLQVNVVGVGSLTQMTWCSKFSNDDKSNEQVEKRKMISARMDPTPRGFPYRLDCLN